MKISIVERQDPVPLAVALNLALSLIGGLACVCALFALNGVDPFFALKRIFLGGFGSIYGLGETATKSIPLILIGVGLVIPYKGKYWNIGAESQLVMGAAFACWAGLNILKGLPGPLVAIGCFVFAAAAGGLWSLLSAFLKVRFSVNEVISTLMLNYVATEFVQYLVVGPMKGKSQFGFPYSDNLARSAWLKTIPGTRIHYFTLALGLLACVFAYFLMMKTKFGYETRVIGENKDAARYAGIDSGKTVLLMALISGCFAGLAGAGELLGIHRHLTYPQNISAGYGFTAIIVAWLARLNPLAVPLAGFFLAGILVGGDAIQIALRLPAATVNVFNGVILLFLIAGDYFLKNKVKIDFGEHLVADSGGGE
jgi:general nucleoside transport system permease protein